MAKLIKRSVLLIAVVISAIFLFSVAVRAEVINPTAKTDLVFNGEAQVLINAGQLTDGDEEGRHYEYKFSTESDEHFGEDVKRMSGTSAGRYVVEWQLVSTREETNVLDAGMIAIVIGEAPAEQSTAPNTGVATNAVIGAVALFLCAIIIFIAYVIREKKEGRL